MTASEAIKIIKNYDVYGCGYCHCHQDGDEIEKAFDMAVEALEQKATLDKIRTEIDRQQKWLLCAGYTVYTVDIALDAIKSIVAESEVEN